MKIAIIPDSPALLGNRLFNGEHLRDGLRMSWRAIREAAESKGWQLATFDRLPVKAADKVLAFNFETFPGEVLAALRSVGIANMVAIVREPPGVAPLYYDRDIQSCFGKYCLPVAEAEATGCTYLEFPVIPIDIDWLPFESRKLLVSITSGKFQSFQGSLYTERIRAIKHFQRACPEQFDMFGTGWRHQGPGALFSTHRLFPSYKGPVESKHRTMRQYRFALCYENTSNLAGYVSEKIMDPLRCGCVPIYLGAPDIARHIPRDCFIDRRKFSSYGEMEAFITTMDSEAYEAYMHAIRSYLASSRYARHLPKSYARRVIRILETPGVSRGPEFTREGIRTLSLRASLQGLRTGGFREKIKQLLFVLRHSRAADWRVLVRAASRLFFRKLGVMQFVYWWRILKI